MPTPVTALPTGISADITLTRCMEQHAGNLIAEPVSGTVQLIAEQLSDNDITEKIQAISVNSAGEKVKKKTEKLDDVDLGQMSFFETVKDEDVLKELAEINISTLTPLDALNTLYKLQNKINNRFSFGDK